MSRVPSITGKLPNDVPFIDYWDYLVFRSLIRTFAPVMVQQIEITLKPKRRGFHLVTSEIVSHRNFNRADFCRISVPNYWHNNGLFSYCD